jgi:hypothetical protein
MGSVHQLAVYKLFRSVIVILQTPMGTINSCLTARIPIFIEALNPDVPRPDTRFEICKQH